MNYFVLRWAGTRGLGEKFLLLFLTDVDGNTKDDGEGDPDILKVMLIR